MSRETLHAIVDACAMVTAFAGLYLVARIDDAARRHARGLLIVGLWP